MSDARIKTSEDNSPAEALVWKKFSLVVAGLVWAWIVVRAVSVALAQGGSPAGQAIYLVLMFAGGCLLAVMTYCILMCLKLTFGGAARLLRREPPLNDAH